MAVDQDQEKIVNHVRMGNALVLAGAGSGKTHSVVERVVRLIQEGVSPSRILLLTFTNKAAKEMRSRILERLPEGTGSPNATTFHSFGYRFIQKNYQECSRNSFPSLMDEPDQTKLLETTIEAAGVSKKKDRGKFDGLVESLSLVRSAGVDFPPQNEELVIFQNILMNLDMSPSDGNLLIKIHEAYTRQKQEQNILDFDDLVELPRMAMERHPELQKKVSEFLLDITVDESQDNNRAQYKLMRMFRSPTNSFMMVGDDDQSIYKFRGAAPECMSEYIKEFNPVVYRLERNYRSQPDIVSSASNMVRRNEERMEKNPYAVADHNGHSNIGWVRHARDNDMATSIAKSIREDIQKGLKFSDIAVMYRVNAMAQRLEKALFVEGIPYFVKKSISMLDRKEIRLMLATIRLSVNRDDGLAFKTVAEIIPNLGEKGIQKILDTRNFFNSGVTSPSVQACIDKIRLGMDDIAQNKGPEGLFAMMANTMELRPFLTKRAEAAVKTSKETAGLEGRELEKAVNAKIAGYVRNMREIQEGIIQRINEFEDMDLDERWAEAMDLITSPPEYDDGEAAHGRVTLTTIHGAKGLEWSVVHGFGVSSTMMPMGEDPDIEEERRLAYVMFTRAKERFIAHHADKVFVYGREQELLPSRFITEAGLPEFDNPNDINSYSLPDEYSHALEDVEHSIMAGMR